MNKPPIGKRWKSGQSGNPRGRPPNILGRKLKHLTHEQVRDCISVIFSSSIEELRILEKSKTETILRVALAKAFLKAADCGDMRTLDLILNRLIGKCV